MSTNNPTLTTPELNALLAVLTELYPDHYHTVESRATGEELFALQNEGKLIDSAVAALRRALPPGSGEDTANHERATRAHKALDAIDSAELYDDTRQTAGDETFITDLLTDLRHLCHSVDVDFGQFVNTSKAHFEAELRGEG